VFCREIDGDRKAAYERTVRLSSLPLAEEISARLRNAPTKLIIRDGDAERVATLEDLREYLAPLGLEVTTKEAVDWATAYPGSAATANRICDLQQQIDTLTQVAIEKKSAAE
jgi:hypothetical protein